MPNYEIETQVKIGEHTLPALRYAKEQEPEAIEGIADKVFCRFYLVKASYEDGMGLQTVAAVLFRDATDAKGNLGLIHRPYFMVKKDHRTGDELLGWISCAPHKLRTRMAREGMVRVNEQALASGTLKPMPDWKP